MASLEVEREEENTRRQSAYAVSLEDVRAAAHDNREDEKTGQVSNGGLSDISVRHLLDSGVGEQYRDAKANQADRYGESSDQNTSTTGERREDEAQRPGQFA